MNEVYVIMYKNRVYSGRFFENIKVARNWLLMQYNGRKFKEPTENEFICTRYGTHFKIIELVNHKLLT